MKGSVGIKGFLFHCIIGVYDAERVFPRPLSVDLAVDFEMTSFKDDLLETVDYASLGAIVEEVAVRGGYKLLETLAYFSLYAIHEKFSPKNVRIRIEKKDAVAAVNVCFVELEMTEEEFRSGK